MPSCLTVPIGTTLKHGCEGLPPQIEENEMDSSAETTPIDSKLNGIVIGMILECEDGVPKVVFPACLGPIKMVQNSSKLGFNNCLVW